MGECKLDNPVNEHLSSLFIMKFSTALLAAPFMAGALAKPKGFRSKNVLKKADKENFFNENCTVGQVVLKNKAENAAEQFACFDACADPTPYRNFTDNSCHDCTAEGFEVVTGKNGKNKCVNTEKQAKKDSKKDKKVKKDKKDKKDKKHQKKDELKQQKKDEKKQEKLDAIKAEKDEFAANNCSADQVVLKNKAEDATEKFACFDACEDPTPYRNYMDNSCHDCSAEGFEIATNKAGEEVCVNTEKQAKKENKKGGKKDGKKDNKKDGPKDNKKEGPKDEEVSGYSDDDSNYDSDYDSNYDSDYDFELPNS